MKKSLFNTLISALLFPSLTTASPYFSFKDGDHFKRFAISIGWLHAMPQGKANPININTSVAEGTTSTVGSVTADSVLSAIDQSSTDGQSKYNTLNSFLNNSFISSLITEQKDGVTYLKSSISGEATINGLSHWQAQNTGLEAQDVSTMGMLLNYNFTDHWSLELKLGIPPKVNMKGKGSIYAPLSGTNSPSGIGAILGDLPLSKNIFVSDLTQGNHATTVRAWLPAAEIHYQFGRSSVNKFRPYLGVGVIYAYFNHIKLNSGIESDLIAAGHMVQNINNNAAGAALDGKTSSADPRVKVKASSTVAPIATIGATYDFNDNWFAAASVSYAKMNNKATITVTDNNTGTELIRSQTKIDIDPIITYVGIGYRF